MLTENRFPRDKEKWDYTVPSIPEAEQNYQNTAIANHSGTKAPPPTQAEFFFCFSHWLGARTSHESSKFLNWTRGTAEINENFTIVVSGGQNAGAQLWKGGVKIFTDFGDISHSLFGVHLALGWTWCHGRVGCFWRLMNSCLMYLILEPDFPSYSEKYVLSLWRRKPVTQITAVICVNTFAPNLRGQRHLKSWGSVLPDLTWVWESHC